MGHASITVTLDQYGHLYPEMAAPVAAALDRIVRGDRQSEALGLRNMCAMRKGSRGSEAAESLHP